MVLKTTGIGDLLRAALANVAGIACAFVYGSVAAGDDNADSDIDIMIVGTSRTKHSVKQIEACKTPARDRLGSSCSLLMRCVSE